MSHEDGRPGPEVPALDPWMTDSRPELQRRVHEAFVDEFADDSPRRLGRGRTRRPATCAAGWRGRARARGRVVGRATSTGRATGIRPRRSPTPRPGARTRHRPWSRNHPRRCAGATRASATCCSPKIAPSPRCSTGSWRRSAPRRWISRGTSRSTSSRPISSSGRVPGFLARAEIIARYEAALGRAVVDLEWHEIFAFVRSTAINDRQARLAAASGVDVSRGRRRRQSGAALHRSAYRGFRHHD